MIRNEPESVNVYKDKLYGIYRAVVEDNDDSEEWKDREWEGGTGRIRVRVFGLHTEMTTENNNEEGIPVNQLPWAEPAISIMEGGVTGKGIWSVPLQGSHVFVFFEGGEVTQPRYFASAPAIQPKETDYNRDVSDEKGFKDPDEEYPKEELMDEPDINRLMRGGSVENTAWEKMINTNGTGGCGTRWSFSPGLHTVTYPNNFVIETSNGQTLELNPLHVLLYQGENSWLLLKSGLNLLKGSLEINGGLETTNGIVSYGGLNVYGNVELLGDTIKIGCCNGSTDFLVTCGGFEALINTFNTHTHPSDGEPPNVSYTKKDSDCTKCLVGG